MNAEIVALAIIQGITEFLPISSSAHASLYSYFFGQGSHSITLDIALHFGSLLALLIFFYQEWLALAGGAKDILQRGSQRGGKGDSNTQRAKIFTRITLATLPLIIVAVVIAQADALENLPRSPSLIAATSIVFALILLAADAKRKSTHKNIEEISKLAMLGLGAVQCLALMPGASRAGVVMTVALLYGLGRTQAARLALLTAMPVLIGASVLGAVSVLSGGWSMQAEGIQEGLKESLLAVSVSFIVSLIALSLLMRSIKRIGLLPFVVYRVALGLAIIVVVALNT